MWRLEKDPHLSSTFAAVTILDRPPKFDRLLARMERAVNVVTRLGQRVQPMPANLTAPTWVDDTNFDLRFHVRHLALPKPGTMRQLLDLASLIACDPFDRTRPLWQFVVVDGLRGGKSALIEKLHHTITDGEGSVKLSLQFLDFERDAPDPPPLDAAELDDREPAPADSNGDFLHDLLAGSMRMPLGLLRQIRDLLERSDEHPQRRLSGCRHRARHHEPARRYRAGQVAAVDPAIAEAAHGSAARTIRRDAGSRKATRRHAQHRVPHRCGGGRGPLSPTDGLGRRGAASEHGHQHTRRRVRLQRILPGAHAGADRRHADRRAVHLDPGGRWCRPRVERDGVARDARRGCLDLADIADHATRTPAGADGRLRHIQRSRCTGAAVRRWCRGLENYAVGPVGRRGVQPDAAQLQPQPRHGSQHRHGCRDGAGTTA